MMIARWRSNSPTFFFHNLLVPSPVLTLSYGSSLLSPRGVKKEVKYSAPGESITEFKNQMPISLEPTLANFIYYVLDVKSGKYGVAAVFVPHFFLDVITLGSSGEAYYLGTIERCAQFIETLSNINFNIIGSVVEWKTHVEHYSNLNAEMSIVENSRELKLPELNDGGLQIDVVENFWELLNKE